MQIVKVNSVTLNNFEKVKAGIIFFVERELIEFCQEKFTKLEFFFF